MRVLVLEDDAERQKWFRQKFIGQHLDITDSPQEANELIRNMEYNFIFLDHDLMEYHYDKDTSCNKTTGLCTAEFLEENTFLCKDAEIFVHSLNPAGSERMAKALRNRKCRQVPYDYLKKNLIVHKV